ncbi:MAG: HD domain-containing phosphohydrolase [Atribacterota bacterium]
MRYEEKTKDQLIKEMQEMQKKITELEKVKVDYNQLEEKLKQSYKKLQKIMEGTANVITKVVEIRDPYSTGHQPKVSKLATAIAQEMKLPQDKIEGTRIASLVHDIGKVNLPTEIVSKPSKLVEVEFNLLKNHPRIGYDILKKVDFPWPVAEIVFQHQEKIDGSGYPRGLKGDEICIEAKILGVANVVEAMSSYKSYRPALSIGEALAEISKNKNILFDSEVVDTCLKLFKEKGFKF